MASAKCHPLMLGSLVEETREQLAKITQRINAQEVGLEELRKNCLMREQSPKAQAAPAKIQETLLVQEVSPVAGRLAAEKAVVAYGGVQMGQLEKNVSWISLFIALAPMLGFMGTVIGMIQAFDKIEAAGDMQPSLVAGGIKVALLTTVFGLIVAIILQIFYNYIIAKIDSIVNDMEDASITLIDMLVAYKKRK